MNKKIKNYYKIVFLAVLLQLITTVVSISNNIAYGQQIEVLKDQEELLIAKENKLNQAIAQEISLRQLANYPDFEDTKNFLVVEVKDNTLAWR
jgi:hypothetical protein